MRSLLIFSVGLLFVAAMFPTQVSASHHPPVTVKILDDSGVELSSFDVASANQATGVSVAAGDLGNDGIEEIVVGNGLGNEPRVRILRQDGSEIASFLAYSAEMGSGLNVVVCDVDGDADLEIITSPQKGGGPQVRMFSATGETIGQDFFAYGEDFRDGVNLVCGDLDDDGIAELITLPGTGGGPHVRVWKWDMGAMSIHEEFFAFDATDHRGLVGTIQDGELVIASQQGHTTPVRHYRIHSTPVLTQEETATDAAASGISTLTDWNDALLAATIGSGSLFDVLTGTATAVESAFGSVTATPIQADDDAAEELLIAPARPAYAERPEGKSITVDIGDQRLYAYENGVLANTFLVSTGRYPFSTPTGQTSVLDKKEYVHYAWSYGPGNPNNYDLGVVRYNLRIYAHMYIHYAYWHNNFGHAMSHGCVNVSYENMEWVYNWADVGVPVEVRS